MPRSACCEPYDLLRPVTSMAGVIAPIMATSLAERMLCGCIDIGTNTTRVLVADAGGGRRRVDRDRRRDGRRGRRVGALVPVRLGLPGRRVPGRRPAVERGARGRARA